MYFLSKTVDYVQRLIDDNDLCGSVGFKTWCVVIHVVCVCVCEGGRGEAESEACCAGLLRVVAMCLEVGPKPCRLRERPATVLTLVWLLPRMESLVTPQCRGLTKGPVTVLALVGSLPRVDASMCPQTSLRAEVSLALDALPSPIL